MKNLLKLLTILLFSISYAQHKSTYEKKILTTSTGHKLYRGLKVKMGKGDINDNYYKFIRQEDSLMVDSHSSQLMKVRQFVPAISVKIIMD